MNNWTIILDYSLTSWIFSTTSWWGSQCSKFSTSYSHVNGCKQEFSNILQKVPKIGQKCSLACGLAAGRPIRGVCPNCRLTLHSAANSAFMTCLTNYVIIWGANSPTTSTSTSTSCIWGANFNINTNATMSNTWSWYNWYNCYYLSGRKFSTKSNTNTNNYHSFNTNINIVFNTDIYILFDINIFMTCRPIM